MSEMKTVDLDQFFITLGAIRMQGFADGDAATWAYDGPAFITKVGADGLVTRSKNYNRTALVTVRLAQASSVNDLLSAIHNADMAAPNGVGVFPFMIEDGQGTTELHSEKAWIESPPDGAIAAEGQPREWKIRCAELVGNHGGN